MGERDIVARGASIATKAQATPALKHLPYPEAPIFFNAFGPLLVLFLVLLSSHLLHSVVSWIPKRLLSHQDLRSEAVGRPDD